MFRWGKTTMGGGGGGVAMAPPSDGEVRVQKVDKIELVRNLVTKPSVYHGGNPMSTAAGAMSTTTTMKRGAAAGGGGGHGGGSGGGGGKIMDINKRSEIFIRERKRQFLGQ